MCSALALELWLSTVPHGLSEVEGGVDPVGHCIWFGSVHHAHPCGLRQAELLHEVKA